MIPLINQGLAKIRDSIPSSTGRVGMWLESTVLKQEELASKYLTRDADIWQQYSRLMGIVASCVEKNAAVCSSIPLRLYRVIPESSTKERRNYPGRKSNAASRRRIKMIKNGSAGTKAAMLAEMGGEIEEVTDHPMLDFVMRPNPMFAGSAMSYIRFHFKWGVGEFYEFIVDGRDGTPLKGLPLYPQYTKIIFDKSGYIDSFNYGRDQSDPASINPKEVIFYRHRPSSIHPLRGEGPLARQLPQADILFKNMMHDIAFVDGGNRPDSIVSLKDPDATEDDFKYVRDQIRKMATGAAASVKAFVTRDIDWKPLSFAPKDLNTPEKLDRYERHIRTAFGHVESMADSTETNVASAVIGHSQQYLGGAIRPACITDACELTDFLIPRFGFRPGQYFFVYDDPVTIDTEKMEARLREHTKSGLITINDFREETGRDPSEDPAAEVLRFNGVKFETIDQGQGQADPNSPAGILAGLFRGGGAPSTEEIEEAVSQAEESTTSDGSGAESTGDPEESTDAAESKSVDLAMMKFEILSAIEAQKEAESCPACGIFQKDAGLTGDTDFDALIRDSFPKFRDEMKRILEEMESETIDSIVEGRSPNLANPTERMRAAILDQFDPLVNEMAKRTVNELAERGIGDQDFTPTSAVESYRAHVSRVSADIAAYTEELIKPAITRAVENGVSVREIKETIQEAGIPEWRAETIARTEISEAMNGSRYDTMDELGIEKFDLVNAPNPSKAHAEIARRSPVKKGEPFVRGGEEIHGEKFKEDKYRPPLRPRCRCRIEPHFDD